VGDPLRGFLKEVIPTNRQLLLRVYEFYWKNDYSLPPLLDRVINGLEGKD